MSVSDSEFSDILFTFKKAGSYKMQLYHDIPASNGVANALKRAQQMVNLQWTPVRDIPAGEIRVTTEGRKHIDLFYPGGRPQQGVGYSSVRIHEKFVGDNVLFETYITALSNPRSAMYTRPQHGLGRSMFNFYGTVCSSFAAYVYDLPIRCPTGRWIDLPGMHPVDSTKLENLRLGDAVLKPGDHIAIITDIQRDIEGKVHIIEVSESETPSCVAKEYTPESFRTYWLANGYGICRYAGIHDVTYIPDSFSPVDGDPPMPAPIINTSLMPDYGNKSNYMLGDSVELDVMEEEWTHVSIAGPEQFTLPIAKDMKVTVIPTLPGYYTACCVNGEKKSAFVEFRITDMEINGDKTVCRQGESLEVTFKPADLTDKLHGWIIHTADHLYRGGGYLNELEAAAGKVSIPIILTPGEYYVFIMGSGCFGKYRSPGFYFCVQQ